MKVSRDLFNDLQTFFDSFYELEFHQVEDKVEEFKVRMMRAEIANKKVEPIS